VEIFTAQLCNHLVALGHEVKIITLFPGSAHLPFEGEIIHLQRNPKNRLLDLVGYKALANSIKTEKPDIVQANAGDTLKYAALSKFLFGWKSKLVYRNASMVSSYITNWRTKAFNHFLYRQVEYIFSVTPQTRDDLNQLFPFTRGIVEVIPIGIEITHTHSIVQKKHAPVILHVGGFSFEKNHAGLLRIFGKLKADFPEAQLWLIGDGVLRQEIEQLVSGMNLSASVTFIGSKPNVRDYMSVADVLVLPSVIEGLPAVLLEAMAEGCPVVAYDVGGIGGVVHDRNTGMLVKKGDEERFVNAIVELLHNEVLRKTVLEKSYELVKREFRNEKIAERFIARYKQILQPHF
jgi:L-malate glycosyltransferase